MKVYHSLAGFEPVPHAVVTVGTFDGVHIGHQKILQRLSELSARLGGSVILLTFHPHPRKILFPDEPSPVLLNSLREKIILLEKAGVDYMVIEPFTKEFSMLEYDYFLDEIISRQLHTEMLVIGYDHQFGQGRKGNIAGIRARAKALNLTVIEIPEQDIHDAAVSSTRIRRELQSGNVEEAAALLGYHYTLSGIVVPGKKLGRQLGFPTANIQPEDPDKLVPCNGIYTVQVSINDVRYGGMLSIGHRPTFDNGATTIEVNVFDFDGDLYGQMIELTFIRRLRDEIKYDSVEELIKQISQDKKDSLLILADYR